MLTATTAAGATGLTAGHAGEPLVGRSQGAQLAHQELARSIYHPSLIARLTSRVLNWLSLVLARLLAGTPSWIAVTVLAIAILVVIAAMWYYAGPVRASRRDRSKVIDGGTQPSAAAHRAAADKFAGAGDYQSAIIEGVRAIAADLESRQILPARSGRTAAELGTEIALTIPAEAAAARQVTRLFDDVRYGGRSGSADGYQQVRDLDLRISAASIGAASTGIAGVGAAGIQPGVSR
jgi:hypothetical protein